MMLETFISPLSVIMIFVFCSTSASTSSHLRSGTFEVEKSCRNTIGIWELSTPLFLLMRIGGLWAHLMIRALEFGNGKFQSVENLIYKRSNLKICGQRQALIICSHLNIFQRWFLACQSNCYNCLSIQNIEIKI